MRYFLLLITTVLGVFLKAQNFSGSIFMRDNSSLYLNQIFVTNLSTQKTVLADYEGRFNIPAVAGQKIRFTSIVSERKDITLNAAMLSSNRNMIELTIAYHEIEEVVLNRFRVTGNLKKDVLALNDINKAEQIQKMLGLPRPKGDGTSPQQPVADLRDGGLTFSLESIFDVLSGERKKKERTYAYEKMNNSVKAIRQYFGDSYFTELKIPVNLIDNFLMFVYTSDQVGKLVEENRFEVVAFSIERFLPVYQKRLKNSQLSEIISK